MIGRIGLGLLLGLAAACQGAPAREAPAAERDDRAPPLMSAPERTRGLALCQTYVERVCSCAARDAAFREQCDLARSQPDALKLQYPLLDGREGRLNDTERRLVEAQARAVIAACVHADGALDPASCPRGR